MRSSAVNIEALDSARLTLPIGSRLGSYEILSPLGAGGMGEVFRARDVRLDREVAIKVLPEELFGAPEHVARFEREAKALAALNHSGIAAIHAFEEIDGRHLLVQELLEGETLRQVLASGKPPLRKTLDYAVQIARALAAAHEKGVVHRDLKPENLFVTRDGRVKILDFGLAKLTKTEGGSSGAATNLPTVSKGTEPGVVLGTLGYMSPEQVRGKPADQRSDVFSFGAVLYEMLAGQKAFAGDSAADTMSAILKEDPPDLAVTNSAIPPGLERIVRHCLEKVPEQRFHSAHDVAFALEALSTESAPRLADAAVRTRLRPRLATVLGALAALALGVGAGALLFRSRHEEPPRFRRLTFPRGRISEARFAPDGQTVVYTAFWDGSPTPQLYSARIESPEPLRLNVENRFVAAISRGGQMLLVDLKHLTTTHAEMGTLSQAPISGSASRPLMEDVADADWGPDGASFAVVRAPDWHYRLEYPAGKVLYENAGYLSCPRVSPKGDAVAFFDHPIFGDDRGAVCVVDLHGKKTTLSAGWESAHGLAWSPRGDELWFTGSETGSARQLHAVSLSGRRRLLATTPAGMTLQDVSKDGRILVTEDQARLRFLALFPGETAERDVASLDWPINPILSADGRTLAFSEEGEGGGPGYSVYLRSLEHAPGQPLPPAVRLGEGDAVALSADGKWVLANLVTTDPPRMVLLPTGVGPPRPITPGATVRSFRDSFAIYRDGKRVLFTGQEAGHALRSYVQDVESGATRPVTPEGVVARLLSNDERTFVVSTPDGRLALLPADGASAAPRPLAGTEPGDWPLAWATDERAIFVRDSSFNFPARIYRIDLATGRRETWKEHTPADTAGLNLRASTISADGRTVVLQCRSFASTLYLAEGIR